MSNHRRILSDVLDLNPRVDSFIQKGVTKPSGLNEEKLTDTTSPKNRVTEGQTARESRPSQSRKKSKARIVDTQWTKATMSKATIQKTVRFNPQLIARWEQINQAARENGETPKSFQHVQNEALSLWLENN